MENEVVQLLGQTLELSETEKQALIDFIPVKNFAKGTLLLQPGQVAQDGYYCFEGCVRSYYLVDGEEKTTAFYIEADSFAAFTSLKQQVPTEYYLACVEDCRLAVMNRDAEVELYQAFPRYETLCRGAMEESYGLQQDALAKFIMSSPEQRYLNLLETRPNLLNRVPQYLLASYLGVAPETLSRIRKRVALKNSAPS